MTEASEEQIAALREEIRRAGRGARSVRWWSVGCVTLPILILGGLLTAVEYSGTHLAPPHAPEPTISNILQSVAAPIPGAVLLGVLIGLPLAIGYRSVRRAQLRRQLAALSPKERHAVLLPLRRDPLGDTRRIVAPMMWEFADPAEVTPTDAPTGRGDEPTP